MQYGTLDGGTLYFHFALNTTAGEGSDATGTPTFDVRLCGAAASAAPVLSGNCDLLSHADFPPGAYEIAVVPSTANGFITGNTYAVFCEAVVSSVNPTGYVGSFILAAIRTDIDEEALALAVVAEIQAIPGFTVEVVSPTNETGQIEITQGDAYLEANSRNLAVTLTGSLPSLETACSFKFFFGGTVTTIAGTIETVSATNYKLKCDLTGVQTAAMPVGAFQYEVEVTYASTTNKWTPSKGKFIVKGQL